MPDQQATNQKPCCRGLFRFHLSTLLIASLLLSPWLLVALPGRQNGGAGSSGVWTTHHQHGLPFVFLDRQTIEFNGATINGKWVWGAKPTDIDCDARAAKHLADWIMRAESPERTRGQFIATNDRTEDLEISSLNQSRFWSDPDNWPRIGTADGEAMQIRWFGLLADLSLILVVFWMFASVVEYRLKKRGKHFAFSLAELLATTCIAGIFLTWFTAEYRRALKENNSVDRLVTAVANADGHIQGIRSNSLPVLVSELFDHRSCVPMLENHLFRQVDVVSVSIYDMDGVSKGTAESLADAIQNAGFPIDLDIDIDEQTLPMFQTGKSLSAVKILGLGFYFDPEWDDQTDSYIDDVVLDFKLNLPEICQLSVELQSEIDQQKQLGILTSMKSLELLEIKELNQKGAAYLSTITNNFPSLKELDISCCFEYFRDNETDALQDYIDPNFKLKLPEADETRMSIWLQTEIDQRKQLETFSLLQHLDRITINDLNQEGAAYLASAASEFPTAKQLEISFDFFSDLDNPILANRYKIDLDFKFPFPRTEEIKINLHPEYGQKKQLRMFAPLNRFKRLRISGLTRTGATYLNSIASELPSDTGVEFDSKEETLELLPPAKQTNESIFAPW